MAMTVSYKRLGKLTLNRALPHDATHYRLASGALKPISEPRAGEAHLYYMIGDHRDLYLAQVGRVRLATFVALDPVRHFGGSLPGPHGKQVSRVLVGNAVADAMRANPELAPVLERFLKRA